MPRLSQLTLAWFVLIASPLWAADKTAEVRIVKDVPYLGEGRQEKLDLYLPPESQSETLRPAVVIIHGGGWTGGDKAAGREQNIGKNLAGEGYVCASINYELAPKKEGIAERLHDVWPRNLYDCKTAVRYLRANAKKYKIDPEHIGAIGGSAGGHLVAMLAVTDADDGLEPEGPYKDFSSRIQAVVPMYGAHDLLQQAKWRKSLAGMNDDDRKICRNASPVTYITPDDPPALILHGTKDALVPTEQSEILFEQLQAKNVPADLLIIEEAPHSFHLQPKQKDLRPVVFAFFAKHLKGEK